MTNKLIRLGNTVINLSNVQSIEKGGNPDIGHGVWISFLGGKEKEFYSLTPTQIEELLNESK